MWPCEYNLTDEGATRRQRLLKSAARRAATDRLGVHFAAGCGETLRITKDKLWLDSLTRGFGR